MSTMTINSMNTSKVVDFQGFQANPSGRITLNRRGKLARTLVVLSLAIVAASVAGGQAGACSRRHRLVPCKPRSPTGPGRRPRQRNYRDQ
jgi:hypothetical protein